MVFDCNLVLSSFGLGFSNELVLVYIHRVLYWRYRCLLRAMVLDIDILTHKRLVVLSFRCSLPFSKACECMKYQPRR